jgi:acyl-CoA dehydrogenase family protein 9
LSREAVLFEECTTQLARHVENVLRKHGRDIAERQFVQRRVADVAIDLYALAACLSRTTLAIERHGEEAALREIEHTRIFATLAHARLRQNIAEFEANDDELRKDSAKRAYADGRYALDVI